MWLVGLMLVPSVMAERKKVGLVLGGGGAKGVAHIGVLKVLEEAGIPIVGEIPRSDEIIRWEDQGKTVIEGDSESEISRRFFDLAEMLLKAEEEE